MSLFGGSSSDNQDDSYATQQPVPGEELLAATTQPIQSHDDSSYSDNSQPVNDGQDSFHFQSSSPSPAASSPQAQDLSGLKEQVLSQLSPIVSHLDQSPEEKYKTTMMMIQATDDQSLLQSAYAAAQQIPDEKVKAQALLDIINEINYFTKQSSQS